MSKLKSQVRNSKCQGVMQTVRTQSKLSRLNAKCHLSRSNANCQDIMQNVKAKSKSRMLMHCGGRNMLGNREKNNQQQCLV